MMSLPAAFDAEEENSCDIAESLRSWFLQTNVSMDAFKLLLNVLRPHFPIVSPEDWCRMELLLVKDPGAKQLHTRLTRLRAPTLSGLVAQMMQTILRPVFARQVNNTGINRKIAFRDSKILAIMRGVILAREDAQAGDGLLLPAAIQSWLKGSRDRGIARRRVRRCSEATMIRYLWYHYP
ncbi:hypothetical protein AHF37_08253 [Paragonimus kellicotti]|nr:hypothetical protein AHF37_08253 [Paragonimus kellicotti]